MNGMSDGIWSYKGHEEGDERSMGMDQLDEWKWSDKNGLDRCEGKDVISIGECRRGTNGLDEGGQ